MLPFCLHQTIFHEGSYTQSCKKSQLFTAILFLILLCMGHSIPFAAPDSACIPVHVNRLVFLACLDHSASTCKFDHKPT
jgi:hypothetical protein